jgi:hypothetical protein
MTQHLVSAGADGARWRAFRGAVCCWPADSRNHLSRVCGLSRGVGVGIDPLVKAEVSDSLQHLRIEADDFLDRIGFRAHHTPIIKDACHPHLS